MFGLRQARANRQAHVPPLLLVLFVKPLWKILFPPSCLVCSSCPVATRIIRGHCLFFFSCGKSSLDVVRSSCRLGHFSSLGGRKGEKSGQFGSQRIGSVVGVPRRARKRRIDTFVVCWHKTSFSFPLQSSNLQVKIDDNSRGERRPFLFSSPVPTA